jgi:GNAT superfamily N-acetyltransferase
MANREDVDLSAYLAPKGKAPGIGAETGATVRDGISLYKSPHGSNRYLYSKQGAAVGVLQVVEISPGVAVIANVYTSPEWRRKGIATKLYERASKDFAISLPDKRMLSKAGLAWSKQLKGFRKNGTVCHAKDLKDYLNQEIDYYDYAWMIDDWSEGKLENDYEALSDEEQKEFRKYVAESDEIDRLDLDTNAPAYRFFEEAEVLPEGSWLIHFTNKSFGSFKYGAVLETLALSTHFSKREASCSSNLSDEIGIHEVVWAFAMDATDHFRHLKDACSQYGRNFLLFKTDCAVKAYHQTDNQWQCIFPICSEYDVFTGSMTRGGDVSLDTDVFSGFDGADCDSIEEAIDIAERALAGEFKNKKEEDEEEEDEEELEPNKRIQLNFSEANSAAQKVAKALVDAIDPEYFKQDEESKLEGLHGLGIPLIEVMEKATVPVWISVHNIDVYVLLECVEPNRPSPRTYLSAQAGWNKYGTKKHPVVTIFLNGHQRLSHFKSWAAVLQIEHALRHELTHVIDPKLMKGVKIGYGIVGRDKATDAVEYANEIAEVKAFGNELAYWLKDHLQSVGCYDLSDPKCRAELDAAIEAQFTEEWPFTHMTEANRRRVRKDVYLYLAGEES